MMKWAFYSLYVVTMDTPFGEAIETYASIDDFYAKYPKLAEGWTIDKNMDVGPKGWDLVLGLHSDWLVVFCVPDRQLRGWTPAGDGTVVAFKRPTGEYFVLAKDMSFEEADRKYTE